MTVKLTAKIFMTLDGVYQGGGGPDEDRPAVWPSGPSGPEPSTSAG